KGGLERKRPGHGWEKAKKGTKLYARDQVRTALKGRAAITWCGGGSAYLNKDAAAVLVSRSVAEARKGEVALQAPAGKERSLNTSSFKERSTGAYVDASVGEKRATVTVVEGSATVQNERGKVTVKKDQQTVVVANAAPAKPVP